MSAISIIIPLYNKEKFIKKTIESVLNQSFNNFELIVINDGSTDKGLSLVKDIKDKRIRTYTIKNSGVSRARNYGINKAKYDLIAFLDGDDLWKKNHLQEVHKLYLRHPNCGLYAMGYNKIFNNGKAFRAKVFGLDNFSGIIDDFFLSSLADCVAWSSAVMIPKRTFAKVGYFNEDMRSGQDTELWIRIALKFDISYSSKITSSKIIFFNENHLSNSLYKIDRLKIFKQFKLKEAKNPSLKTFLDLNRFSIAIERKQKGDINNYIKLRNSICKKNLNIKQKILLKLPSNILILLRKIQIILLKVNVYLTPFKYYPKIRL